MRRAWQLVVVALASAPLWAPSARTQPKVAAPYELLYDVRVVPSENLAYVTITLGKGAAAVKRVTFTVDPERQIDFSGSGAVTAEGGLVSWVPPQKGAELSYTFRIDHLRDEQRYDARATSTFALFRGDDLVPPAAVRSHVGAVSEARLRLRLPEGWRAVSTHAAADDGTLIITNPDRRFDRPTGWFLVGKLTVSSTRVAGTRVTIASPKHDDGRQKDVLAFLRWTLPELKELLGELPRELLIVMAGDPMWRGGLSGPGSLYLHAERPLIDDDYTSPVLHEIVHTTMRARSAHDGDWIVEGIAELYSLEALVRSKGISKKRYLRAIELAKERGRAAGPLTAPRSEGALTAKAVVVLKALDDELRARCQGTLDDVVKRLVVARGEVSTAGFLGIAEDVGKCELDELFERHIPGALEQRAQESAPEASPAGVVAIP